MLFHIHDGMHSFLLKTIFGKLEKRDPEEIQERGIRERRPPFTYLEIFIFLKNIP